MMISKCDICKKIIKKDEKKISTWVGWLGHGEFCFDCGSPVIKFLLKNKLIAKEEINKLQ